MQKSDFREGDIVRYEPEKGPHRPDPRWCREGYAVVIPRSDGSGLLVQDTYWQITYDPNSHFLTREEEKSATLLFNLNDFEPITHESTWKDYAETDRVHVSEQHGLRERLFVRKGSKPSMDMKIENARNDVEAAKDRLRSAEFGVRGAQDWLERLLSEKRNADGQ